MKIMNGNTVEKNNKIVFVATARVKKHFVISSLLNIWENLFFYCIHIARHRVAQQRASLFCGTASPRDSHADFQNSLENRRLLTLEHPGDSLCINDFI